MTPAARRVAGGWRVAGGSVRQYTGAMTSSGRSRCLRKLEPHVVQEHLYLLRGGIIQLFGIFRKRRSVTGLKMKRITCAKAECLAVMGNDVHPSGNDEAPMFTGTTVVRQTFKCGTEVGSS